MTNFQRYKEKITSGITITIKIVITGELRRLGNSKFNNNKNHLKKGKVLADQPSTVTVPSGWYTYCATVSGEPMFG